MIHDTRLEVTKKDFLPADQIVDNCRHRKFT